EQYRIADNDLRSLEYAKRSLIAKISNSRKYVLRFRRDHPNSIDVNLFDSVEKELLKSVELVKLVADKDSLRGIEGNAANIYFRIFKDLVLVNKNIFEFNGRSK